MARTPYLLSALLLAATVALGYLTSKGVGNGLDAFWLKRMALVSGQSPSWLVTATQWLSWLGAAERRALIAVGFAAWLAWDRRFGAALVMLVVPPLAGVGASILKEAFDRPRPSLVAHLDHVGSDSFPSGHATGAVALLLLAAFLLGSENRLVWLGIAGLVAVAVGLSRNMLGVHWPSDVLGGWMLGLAFVSLGVAIARNW
jgi:undecaprenyl-diphosphatase